MELFPEIEDRIHVVVCKGNKRICILHRIEIERQGNKRGCGIVVCRSIAAGIGNVDLFYPADGIRGGHVKISPVDADVVPGTRKNRLPDTADLHRRQPVLRKDFRCHIILPPFVQTDLLADGKTNAYHMTRAVCAADGKAEIRHRTAHHIGSVKQQRGHKRGGQFHTGSSKDIHGMERVTVPGNLLHCRGGVARMELAEKTIGHAVDGSISDHGLRTACPMCGDAIGQVIRRRPERKIGIDRNERYGWRTKSHRWFLLVAFIMIGILPQFPGRGAGCRWRRTEFCPVRRVPHSKGN